MSDPVSVRKDGVKIKPELMEKEKLYHCLFKDKVLLFYKDEEEILNCYEIEETDLVKKVRSCTDKEDVSEILEQYIQENNLKH